MNYECRTVKPAVPIIWADVRECVVDCHMHIMSGNCTPMPLLWNQGIPNIVDRWLLMSGGGLAGRAGDAVKCAEKRIELIQDLAQALVRRYGIIRIGTIEMAEDIAVNSIVYTAMLLRRVSEVGFDFAHSLSDGVIDFASSSLEFIYASLETGASFSRGKSRMISGVAHRLEESRNASSTDGIIGKFLSLSSTINQKILEGAAGAFDGVADGLDYVADLTNDLASQVEKLGQSIHGMLERMKIESAVVIYLSAMNLKKQIEHRSDMHIEEIKGRIRKLDKIIDLAAMNVTRIINSVSPILHMLDIQGGSAASIADSAVKGSAAKWGAQTESTFFPLIALGMDMEYSALCGYGGEKIYHETNRKYLKREFVTGPDGQQFPMYFECSPDHTPRDGEHYRIKEGRFFYYYRRTSASDRGVAHWMHEKEPELFKNWDDQVNECKSAAKAYPWKVLNLFHFEPRRWDANPSYPFKYVVSPNDKPGSITADKLFIGFKMYPPLGYRPWDIKRLPGLKTFFADCESKQIPIISHCSPGGMCTHEREFYFDFDRHNIDRKNAGNPGAEYEDISDEKARRTRYFQEEYTSPAAWKKVLTHHPDLKLCLAHFGGSDFKKNLAQSGWPFSFDTQSPDSWPLWNREIIDLIVSHENVYTDLSYFFALFTEKNIRVDCIATFKEALKNAIASNTRLANRILFGTDWYMILMDNTDYKTSCSRAKEVIDDITRQLEKECVFPLNSIDLWTRFSLINPFRFYDFSAIREPYSTALNMAKVKKNKLVPAKIAIEKMQKRIDTLLQRGRV